MLLVVVVVLFEWRLYWQVVLIVDAIYITMIGGLVSAICVFNLLMNRDILAIYFK